MISFAASISNEIAQFSVNIEDILHLKHWRIEPCDFQIILTDVLGIEVANQVFSKKTLRDNKKKTESIKINDRGFLKLEYRIILQFIKNLDTSPQQEKESFLEEFSKSSNLTNIVCTFGKPHFQTGTSEGYDVYIYFGYHECDKYKLYKSGSLILVLNRYGAVAAYNLVMEKCPCYFTFLPQNNIYFLSHKSEYI